MSYSKRARFLRHSGRKKEKKRRERQKEEREEEEEEDLFENEERCKV